MYLISTEMLVKEKAFDNLSVTGGRVTGWATEEIQTWANLLFAERLVSNETNTFNKLK